MPLTRSPGRSSLSTGPGSPNATTLLPPDGLDRVARYWAPRPPSWTTVCFTVKATVRTQFCEPRSGRVPVQASAALYALYWSRVAGSITVAT
ncbi:hypothetical protein [Streptomyces sp. NPDC058683]|uniref:hypothetical protein n=1 Tax=Streptomyces sp. NPDC058683 TaxID=3346597 RepID=UPI00364DEDCD